MIIVQGKKVNKLKLHCSCAWDTIWSIPTQHFHSSTTLNRSVCWEKKPALQLTSKRKGIFLPNTLETLFENSSSKWNSDHLYRSQIRKAFCNWLRKCLALKLAWSLEYFERKQRVKQSWGLLLLKRAAKVCLTLSQRLPWWEEWTGKGKTNVPALQGHWASALKRGGDAGLSLALG